MFAMGKQTSLFLCVAGLSTCRQVGSGRSIGSAGWSIHSFVRPSGRVIVSSFVLVFVCSISARSSIPRNFKFYCQIFINISGICLVIILVVEVGLKGTRGTWQKTVLIIDDTVISRHIENKNNYTKTVTWILTSGFGFEVNDRWHLSMGKKHDRSCFTKRKKMWCRDQDNSTGYSWNNILAKNKVVVWDTDYIRKKGKSLTFQSWKLLRLVPVPSISSFDFYFFHFCRLFGTGNLKDH